VFFCTLGYSNSFGVFQAYYMLHQLQNETPDNIVWIGAIQAFLVFASGIIGGPLFDRYGAWVIRPAAVLYIFAIMMISLCTQYWQFMLAQGILNGLSCGLLMFPSMSATPQYFHKRRGAALGIAVAGSSAGAILFPIILSKLLNDTNVGFGWTVRITAFIMIPFMVFACLAIKARLPPRKTNFLILSAFKQKLYVSLVVASFFLFIGMFVPLVFLPIYSIHRGMSETLAAYLVAVINGASIFGRIIPGILGDKLGRLNTFIAAGLSTTIITFCWPEAVSNAGIIVFAVAFGFTSGGIISCASVCFTLCTDDPQQIGTYMGQGTAAASLSVLLGLPVSGAILRTVDGFGFREVSIFSGVMTGVGTLFLVVARFATKDSKGQRLK
jgi:MFS family permease